MKRIRSESQKLDPQNFLVFVISVINSYILGGLLLDWESECAGFSFSLLGEEREKASFPYILRGGFHVCAPMFQSGHNRHIHWGVYFACKWGIYDSIFICFTMIFWLYVHTKWNPTIVRLSPQLLSDMTCTSMSQSSPKRCVNTSLTGNSKQ